MFTGIVESKGVISSIDTLADDITLVVDPLRFALETVSLGDSISVSGVCLTVTRLEEGRFAADVSRETLDCTTIGRWRPATPVNLERSVTPSTLLGGHLVSGHVDGMALVTQRHDDGRSVRFTFEAPQDLARYIAAKGSVCLDGISLTVNTVSDSHFSVNLIPHTLQVTTMGTLSVGEAVNLEVDQVARYCERLLGRES